MEGQNDTTAQRHDYCHRPEKIDYQRQAQTENWRPPIEWVRMLHEIFAVQPSPEPADWFRTDIIPLDRRIADVAFNENDKDINLENM